MRSSSTERSGRRRIPRLRRGGASPVPVTGGSACGVAASLTLVTFRQWIGLKIRFQRTVQGQFQICQAGAPSSIEKKITSARPIRFS